MGLPYQRLRRLRLLLETGKPQQGIPEPMLRAARYAAFGKAYGYTPDQVDDLPADVAPYMLPLAHLFD